MIHPLSISVKCEARGETHGTSSRGGPVAPEARGGFGSQPLPDPARLGGWAVFLASGFFVRKVGLPKKMYKYGCLLSLKRVCMYIYINILVYIYIYIEL